MVGVDARWALLALVISTGSIMVLSHGLLGTGSIFTGIFIALSTASLIATGRWKTRLNICDLTFALFVLSIVISSILNGKSDETKEYGLLIYRWRPIRPDAFSTPVWCGRHSCGSPR